MKKMSKMRRKYDTEKKSYRIVSDFSKVDEKYCLDADKHNDKVYRHSLININEAVRIIEKNGLTANLYVPPPPIPNNHEKYILWEKRSVSKSVVLQSHAVLCLHKRGYILDRDYEAYQAIGLANELMYKEGEVVLDDEFLADHKNNFKNLYTRADRNILRRRSMHCGEVDSDLDSDEIIPSPELHTPPLLRKRWGEAMSQYGTAVHYHPFESEKVSQSYPPSTALYPVLPPSAPPPEHGYPFILDPTVSERTILFENEELKQRIVTDLDL